MVAIAPPVPHRRLGHTAIDAELTALYERCLPSVVQISGGNGNGAGTIWRSDGLIVTNAHVAGQRDRLRVVLDDDRSFDGAVIARDDGKDLALVEIDATDLPALEIGDSARIRPGQMVVAIGHPHGQICTLTAGIAVSAGDPGRDRKTRSSHLLQVDARIAPGSSGGPLLDVEGRVLGINTRVSGRLSMAIPSTTVERFIAGFIPGGAHAWLGAQGAIAVLPDGPQSAGFVITGVVADSPAAKAGLILGDVLLTIAGTEIVDAESIPAAMLSAYPGEPVEITMLRGGMARTVIAVPGQPHQP